MALDNQCVQCNKHKRYLLRIDECMFGTLVASVSTPVPNASFQHHAHVVKFICLNCLGAAVGGGFGFYPDNGDLELQAGCGEKEASEKGGEG